MLRVGLMGAGRIAQVHAAILASEVVPGLELVGICDPVLDRAELLAKKHGVASFKDLSSMLGDLPDIAVVAVLSESGNHARHASEVLTAGRHVVLEKPASLQVGDLDALSVFETSDTRVAVVHQNRFNPSVVALRAALTDGTLGKIALVAAHVAWGRSASYYESGAWRGTRALDGGALANQGIHFLDLLLHLFGPANIAGVLRSRFRHPIECEDTASILLEFETGAQGVMQISTALNGDYDGSLSVTGSDGHVRLGGMCLSTVSEWHADDPAPCISAERDFSALGIPSLYGFGHVDFYEDFELAIRTNRPFNCELPEARRAIQLLNDVYDAVAIKDLRS